MKLFFLFCLLVVTQAQTKATEVSREKLAHDYFSAWTLTQSPSANQSDIAAYLDLLSDDIGHQHLPYDTDDTRNAGNRERMADGMLFYLGAHTSYKATLLSIIHGTDVLIIKYHTFSTGIHPQSKEKIKQSYNTVEVLELDGDIVTKIRKYSE